MYFAWCGFTNDGSQFIFCNINKTKSGCQIRKVNKLLTCLRMWKLFIEAFKSIVPDISNFGLYSLRAGGATVCANSGVPDRLFKKHGRWRSEYEKDGYIRDILDSRLLVSLRLGLHV